MGQLDGKVALVTGGASGIGKATVERFTTEGARVCVVDFDDGGGKAVAKANDGIFVHADAGDTTEIDSAFAACERELGGVDVAYLNAGIAIGRGDITELTDDEYRRIIRVNVDGVVWGTRAAIRALQRRGGGAIVATASLAGLIPFPPDPVYDLTKHAVVGFIRSVAPTLVPLGITANTVNPGMTDTNIIGEDTKAVFREAGFPLMPASQIASAVLQIVVEGRTGECWVCQPGREPEPYRFHDVPGPRHEAEGRVPPGIRTS
ncbi:MAG TPA: SDR family oxidoreductase [Acidimicrobiia bacterium]|jgi:NAD(P)-dependent dehydrogenase (short-subunit alcohol dehydrogenase family)